MTEIDVKALAELARIAIADSEVERLTAEMASIVSYVSTVRAIAAEESAAPALGSVYNVLRPDVVTNEPGVYTEKLLAGAPAREGHFLKVPKIIAQD